VPNTGCTGGNGSATTAAAANAASALRAAPALLLLSLNLVWNRYADGSCTTQNTASTKPTVVYQVKAKQVGVGDWLETNFLWVSPSADTFIVQWVSGGNGLSLPNNAGSGVVSHGKYTPLRIPKSVALSAVDITF